MSYKTVSKNECKEEEAINRRERSKALDKVKLVGKKTRIFNVFKGSFTCKRRSLIHIKINIMHTINCRIKIDSLEVLHLKYW